MFIDFFLKVKAAKIPATIREYLMLLEAMDKHVAGMGVDNFYYLSRSALVKDEKYFDRYDRVFGQFFKGIQDVTEGLFGADIPDEWLAKQAELLLSDADKEQIEAMGGWDKLMEELKKRLEEQKGEHHGGNKWIGTGGTSPFGTGGYNPEGVNIGGKRRRQGKRAVHPATQTFQALRMEVNEELEELRGLLDEATEMLDRDGRLAVISYHSGEDRIVKHTLRGLVGTLGHLAFRRQCTAVTGHVAEEATHGRDRFFIAVDGEIDQTGGVGVQSPAAKFLAVDRLADSHFGDARARYRHRGAFTHHHEIRQAGVPR